MLLWIFQQIVISLVVIVLIHSIYRFLQNNLTTPKVRDLVNKPTKRYEEIYKTFESDEITSKEEIKKPSDTSMKNELQNYLKELSSKSTPDVDQKTSQPSIPEAMSFSDNFTNAYQTL